MAFEINDEGDLARVMAAAESALESNDHHFDILGAGRYRLRLARFDIIIEVDRLRREKHELWGELSVYVGPREALIVGRALSIADFNLSSARARQDRAKLLDERSEIKTLNWLDALEEFCQRVIDTDRKGEAAVDLRLLEKPGAEDRIKIEGLTLLRRHPSIIFGDGGAAKSYLCLYLAGRLAEQGMRVALFDWELAGEDHRDRLERLFGIKMPKVMYARCEKALVHEVERLRRIVLDEAIDFAVYDSVAFACDGPPEAAEVASRYFRSVREIGVGSLHVAHINKGDNADKKPFGSTFWHNGARATWFIKAAPRSNDSAILTIGLFGRKANLGPRLSPTGYRIEFGPTRTIFLPTTVTDRPDSPDVVEPASTQHRMNAALRRGPMNGSDLAAEIGAKTETVARTVRRHKDQFVILADGRIARAGSAVE